MSDQTYCYQPDFTVLRNKADIRDQASLDQFERLKTANRIRYCPQDLPITYDGYKAIHQHIFQDVYDWAGQPRTLNTRKELNSAIILNYAPYETIDKEMNARFEKIRSDKSLQSNDPLKFVTGVAEHISEINVIHPFREGNTRTIHLFARNLAHQAGHKLSIAHIDKEQWKFAAYEGYNCRYAAMEKCIQGALFERPQIRDTRIEEFKNALKTDRSRLDRER